MTLFSVVLPINASPKLRFYKTTIHGEFGPIKWCYVIADTYNDLRERFGKNLIDWEKLGDVYNINEKKVFEDE